MQSKSINPEIFRAYDIRGIYPDEIDGFTAYRIGRAFIHFLRNNPVLDGPLKIVVTSDAQASSPELKAELIKGILDEDSRTTVIDAGLSTTPMHAFIINHTSADGGVMITASHNSGIYNGFKLTRRGAYPVSMGGGMEEVCNIAVRGIFETPGEKGSVVKEDFLDAYVAFLRSQVDDKKLKQFKIVFDFGNGMASLVVPKLVRDLPIGAEFLFADIDMMFPNHEANPMKDETLYAIKEKVRGTRADFGVAFDADGDRLGLVTASGYRVPGDHLTALLGAYLAKESPGSAVVYDIRSSKIVPETIEAAGGVPIVSRIGYPSMRALMREHDAVAGGEMTGHYYFRGFFYLDSAVFAFLQILKLLSASDKTLDELAEPLKKYVSSGEVNIQVIDRDRAIDAVAAHFTDAPNISYLDGLRIEYPDFWFIVRPSNTEPLIRIVVEGKTELAVQRTLQKIKEMLAQK